MKLAIVADDLTGANDSGAQLVRAGLKTSVMIDRKCIRSEDQDVIVFDTDSRAVSRTEAYDRVREVSEYIKQSTYQEIYKKIDSTMRGNIGAEIDAIYDTFLPDFIIIAPGFPRNGRHVIEGYHYLHGNLLHETEVASDPKTPVTESFLPKLLAQQTLRPIGLITYKEIRQGLHYVKSKLEQFKLDNIAYLIFDTKDEADLQEIVLMVRATKHRVVWSGSAGLVSYLVSQESANSVERIVDMALNDSPLNMLPVLLVIGSVSPESRKQLEFVLQQPDVIGIEVQCDRIVSDLKACLKEVERVYTIASDGLGSGAHVALYCASDIEDIAKAQELGSSQGWSPSEVSNRISVVMGQIASRLLGSHSTDGVVLTGGDIAKQVISQLGASEFGLIGEVETGVPIGKLIGGMEIPAVTKAGSFGTEKVLLKSIKLLQTREA